MKPIGAQYKKYVVDKGRELLKSVEIENQDRKVMSLKEILEKS